VPRGRNDDQHHQRVIASDARSVAIRSNTPDAVIASPTKQSVHTPRPVIACPQQAGERLKELVPIQIGKDVAIHSHIHLTLARNARPMILERYEQQMLWQLIKEEYDEQLKRAGL